MNRIDVVLIKLSFISCIFFGEINSSYILEIYPHGRSFQQQQENKCTYVRQTKPAYQTMNKARYNPSVAGNNDQQSSSYLTS